MPDDQAMQKNSYYFLTDHLSLLPCLASLLQLQDVASLGSETSGIGRVTRKSYELFGLACRISINAPKSEIFVEVFQREL